MELLHNPTLVPPRWQPQPLENWRRDLHEVCGYFESTPVRGATRVLGLARAIQIGSMRFAQIVNDLDSVRRRQTDIRAGATEHVYLIIQLEGSCSIEQEGRRETLNMGDSILVDSTRPVTIRVGGRLSNHLSLHLPRQAMYASRRVHFDIARKLPANDPMSTMLLALIAKLFAQPSTACTPGMVDFVLEATRQAFVGNIVALERLVSQTRGQRLSQAEALIDRHLTDPELGTVWLANGLRISTRTLQEDFQSIGVTCTELIRRKRLRLVHEQIEALPGTRRGQTIADLAYAAGFNDISYFNRSFRELFNGTPKDLLKAQAGRWPSAVLPSS